MKIPESAVRLSGPIAFSALVGALPLVLGTSDFESYENAFFSLDRGSAHQPVRVFGQPVYTLAIGFGARLPLQASLGASPAAFLAPYLPAPLTYWLLMTCAVGVAALVARYALEPICGRLLSWLALVLLFSSVPWINYTYMEDLPHIAVTYCAFVGCVFAPHAMLTSFGAGRGSTKRHLRVLALVSAMGGLIGGAHPGHWPLLAGTLILTSLLALCRSDHRLQDRLMAVATLGAISLTAVVFQVPDLIREMYVAESALGDMTRGVDGPRAGLISANIFPFGDVDARLPFTSFVMACAALAVGVAARNVHNRAVVVGSALLAILLGIGSATLPALQAAYAPSNTWALRDPALVFAIFSGAVAAAGVVRWQAGSRAVWARLAATVLAFAALQGPAYAVAVVHRGSPEWTVNTRAWNRDMTAPETRVSIRGLAGTQVPPGERLALWPGEADRMRLRKDATVDFADAGYLLVTAWTNQRTMRHLVQPNEVLFDQTVELTPAILCDAGAVRFLRLRYLLSPPGVHCDPWRIVPGLLVDGRLEVRISTVWDTNVRVLPTARLSEPLARAPALSVDSALIPALRPLAGTSLHLEPDPATIQIQLENPLVLADQTLVLPVAYDPAWQSSNGQTREVGGLLGVVGVDQRRVILDFVPDAVALLRAASLTLAQLLAVAGFLSLAVMRPVSSADDLLSGFERRMATGIRLGFRHLQTPARLYLVYVPAVMFGLRWTPRDADETGLLAALLLPMSALAVARLSRSAWWHHGIGWTLVALVVVRTVSVGSLSPYALHDPQFWVLLMAVALGVCAAVRGRPPVAVGAATVSGACAMTAMLVPRVPDFAAVLGDGPADLIREALAALSNQIGLIALLALLGVWLHAIGFGGHRGARAGSVGAMARGALSVALIFALAGLVPTSDGLAWWWFLTLGMLLGLAEAPRERPRPQPVHPMLTG